MRSITDFFRPTTDPSPAGQKQQSCESIVIIDDDDEIDGTGQHLAQLTKPLAVSCKSDSNAVFDNLACHDHILASQTSHLYPDDEVTQPCFISSESINSNSNHSSSSSSDTDDVSNDDSESNTAKRPTSSVIKAAIVPVDIQEITFDTFRADDVQIAKPLKSPNVKAHANSTNKVATLFDPSTWGRRRVAEVVHQEESPSFSPVQPRRGRGRPRKMPVASPPQPPPALPTPTQPASDTSPTKSATVRRPAPSAADRARFFATDFRPKQLLTKSATSAPVFGNLPCPWPASWNAHVGWQPLPSNEETYSFRELDDKDEQLKPLSNAQQPHRSLLLLGNKNNDASCCLATVRITRLATNAETRAIATSATVAEVTSDLPDAERRFAALTSALTAAASNGDARQRSLADLLAPRSVVDIVDGGDDVPRLADWLEGWERRQRLERRERARKRRRRRRCGGVDSEDSDDDYDSYYDDEDDSDSADDEAEAKAALVEGPGKTSLAYALAAQLGLQVFEVNTGERRQGKQLLDRLQEAAICSQVGRQRLDAAPSTTAAASPSVATSGKKRRTLVALATDRRQSKRMRRDEDAPKVVDSPALSRVTVTNACLLLFDDADTLLEDETGFHRLLALVCSVARKPALIGVNDAASFRRQASGGVLASAPLFHLRPAAPAAVAGFARLVAAALGWQLQSDGAAALAGHCGHRIGRLLQLLQYQLYLPSCGSNDVITEAMDGKAELNFTVTVGEPLDKSPLCRLAPLLNCSATVADDRVAEASAKNLACLSAVADAADAGRLADRLRRRHGHSDHSNCRLLDGVADELPDEKVDFAGELAENLAGCLLTKSIEEAGRRLGVSMATGAMPSAAVSAIDSVSVRHLERDLGRRGGCLETLDIVTFLRHTAWLHSIADVADTTGGAQRSSRRRTRAGGGPLMYSDRIGMCIGDNGKRYLLEQGCRLLNSS